MSKPSTKTNRNTAAARAAAHPALAKLEMALEAHGEPSPPIRTPSELALERFRVSEGKPTFLCAWPKVIFVHYEVEPAVLQRQVPFELELFGGKATVSLAAFTMRRFRLNRWKRLGEWLFRPAATNHFFNVRVYVRHHGEPGVFFMTQWLSHPFCLLGRLPGLRLPWHLGRMHYEYAHENGRITGRVQGSGESTLGYAAALAPDATFRPSERGSLAEFAMERYTAFALRGGVEVVFRVWHAPWPQCPVQIEINDNGLLEQSGDWFRSARFAGANYTTGCDDVWMGRVRRIGPAGGDRCRARRAITSAFYEMP